MVGVVLLLFQRSRYVVGDSSVVGAGVKVDALDGKDFFRSGAVYIYRSRVQQYPGIPSTVPG